MTNGRPAISGVARTTKSVDVTTKSANWTTPSFSLSTIEKRPAGCQRLTQAGSLSTEEPTRFVKTALRAKAA